MISGNLYMIPLRPKHHLGPRPEKVTECKAMKKEACGLSQLWPDSEDVEEGSRERKHSRLRVSKVSSYQAPGKGFQGPSLSFAVLPCPLPFPNPRLSK